MQASGQPSGQPAPRAPRRRRTPEDEVSDVSDDASDDETAVDDEPEETTDLMIRYLRTASDYTVAVAEEYPNYKADEMYGKRNINAYAKICGREWTYYVLHPQIFFGRAPDGYRELRQPREGTAAQDNSDDEPPIHIDLGPSKVVSRTHAELRYSQSDEGWRVHVYGRNGVRVNDANLKKGQDMKVRSGTIITIAGTEMLFQSASVKAQIHPSFIDRIIKYNEGLDPEPKTEYQQPLRGGAIQTLPNGPPPSYPGQNAYTRPNLSQQNTIAPGTSDLVRPITPETSPPKRPATGSAKKRSPNSYRRGIMMESTEQIDYALDSSKDLKPACSYASMITWAIISTEEQSLSLAGIYSWIKAHYAYYRHIGSAWQVCEACNLSRDFEGNIFSRIRSGTTSP